jgi:hypothetical protein
MVIQRAVDEGIFPPGTHSHGIFCILLTAILGASMSRLSDRNIPGEDADSLARDTLEAALTGLRAGFPRTFLPVSCEHIGD